MPSSRTHTRQYLAQDSSLLHVTPITHLFSLPGSGSHLGMQSHLLPCAVVQLSFLKQHILPSVQIAWRPLLVTGIHWRPFSVQVNLSLLSYLPLPSWAHLALPPNQSAVPVHVLYSPLLGLCSKCTCHWDALPRFMYLHAQLLPVLQITIVLSPVHRSSQKYLGPLKK